MRKLFIIMLIALITTTGCTTANEPVNTPKRTQNPVPTISVQPDKTEEPKIVDSRYGVFNPDRFNQDAYFELSDEYKQFLERFCIINGGKYADSLADVDEFYYLEFAAICKTSEAGVKPDSDGYIYMTRNEAGKYAESAFGAVGGIMSDDAIERYKKYVIENYGEDYVTDKKTYPGDENRGIVYVEEKDSYRIDKSKIGSSIDNSYTAVFQKISGNYAIIYLYPMSYSAIGDSGAVPDFVDILQLESNDVSQYGYKIITKRRLNYPQ